MRLRVAGMAVTPQTSVFASDLDRLEESYRREYGQQHADGFKAGDDNFSLYGAGQLGKRMQWEPSRSPCTTGEAQSTKNKRSNDSDGVSQLQPRRREMSSAEERHRLKRSESLSRVIMRGQEEERGCGELSAHVARAVETAQQREGEDEGKRRIVPLARHRVDMVTLTPHSDAAHLGMREPERHPGASLSSDRATAADTVGLGGDGGADGRDGSRPPEENPHFPCEELEHDTEDTATEGTPGAGGETLPSQLFADVVTVDRRTVPVAASLAGRTAAAAAASRFNAYRPRPWEPRPEEAGDSSAPRRNTDYWDSHPERRAHLDAVEDRIATKMRQEERLEEGAVDSGEVDYAIHKLRKEVFLFFQAHPINTMITDPYVRLREVAAPCPPTPHEKHATAVTEDFFRRIPTEVELDGPPAWLTAQTAALRARAAATTGLNTEPAIAALATAVQWVREETEVPLSEARRLAATLGWDLIRVSTHFTTQEDRRAIAVCRIGDHRILLREMLSFKLQKLGIQPAPTPRAVEVSFRGGTHPHAMRVKAVGIGKRLLHRHAVKIRVTDFGAPREGFAVLQAILDEVHLQCSAMHAYHRAGQIQSSFDELSCFLYPSSGRSPKTTVTHPSAQEVSMLRDLREEVNEKEIFFDDYYDQPTARDRLRYATRIADGTAWSMKDEGLSLQRQRAIKVMLGYLPKGNSEMYAARGDVDVPAPFRTSHPTGVDRWTHPQPLDNLEAASRGAAVLGKRAAMDVSTMHDRQETADQPSQLDRFYYRVQGSALEVGELKEALGLKGNRKKPIPLGPGFATLKGDGTRGGPTSAEERGFTVS